MFSARTLILAAGLALAGGTGPASAQSLLELCPCQQLPATVLTGGLNDNYAAPNDPASRGPELNAAFPAAIWKDFDSAAINSFVGFTFSNLPADIVCAQLEIHLRPTGDAGNDILYLGLLPSPVGQLAWGTPLSALPGTGGSWNAPLDPAAFTLDLAALPASASSPATSLLAKLNADRRLDILVQDDTQVDYVKLTLRTFPEQVRTVGLADGFLAPTEGTSRSTQLNAAFPGVPWKDLDNPANDRWIGQTVGNLTGNVVQASLETRLRPQRGDPTNDSFNLGLVSGQTFTFSRRVSALPEAGGIWTAGHAETTFRLDLGALPGGGNLLPKINADDRLDFLLQDDTTSDFLRLRYRTCPAPRRFGGFDFDRINDTRFDPLPEGGFNVVTFGAGDGGVLIPIGDGDGLCIGTLACLGGIGTAYDLAVQATIQSLNQPSISTPATLSFLNTGPAVDLSVNFPDPYDIFLSVEVWNQNQLVQNYLNSQGFQGVVNGVVAKLPITACIKELDFIDTLCFRTLLVDPVTIQIQQGGPAVFGDEIRICRSVIGGIFRVSSLALTTPNATTFPINGIASRAFGIFEKAVGAAKLEATRGGLTVSGFGTTGTDGVSLELGAAEAVSATLAPIDPAGTAPVGSFLEAEAFGTIDELPGRSLGTLRITRQAQANRPFEFKADFSNIASPTQRVQVWKEHRLVIDLPGRSGVAARSSSWPGKLGKLGGQTECYIGNFPPDTSFDLDGRIVQGDELRVLAETNVALGAKSALQLRAAGLPELTLTDVGIGGPACTPGPTTLCLNGGRFVVDAQFATPNGDRGQAQAVRLTADTGYFYFFGASNVELVVKALNACGLNSRFWIFSAGLTDVEVDLRVTDTVTGEIKHYVNPLGTAYPPKLDTDAFATCDSGNLTASAELPDRTPQAAAAELQDLFARLNPKADTTLSLPTTAPGALLLNGGRFRVTATFQTFQGQSGAAEAVQLTDDTGYFWFFDSANVEVIVKTLDACTFNSRFWVFSAGLTNVRVVLTVTDTRTGAIKTYTNPLNTFYAPLLDTGAFATCP
jgi:hypothetical protein